jgi:ribosomal protein L28
MTVPAQKITHKTKRRFFTNLHVSLFNSKNDRLIQIRKMCFCREISRNRINQS